MEYIRFTGKTLGWDGDEQISDTISEMQGKIKRRYGFNENLTGCFNEFGEQLPYDDIRPGVLYWTPQGRMQNVYIIELEPFEAEVRIVDRSSKTFILQDVTPDKTKHLGFTPLYEVYPSFFLPMLRGANMQDGVFHNTFTFKNQGSVTSLALA